MKGQVSSKIEKKNGKNTQNKNWCIIIIIYLKRTNTMIFFIYVIKK